MECRSSRKTPPPTRMVRERVVLRCASPGWHCKGGMRPVVVSIRNARSFGVLLVPGGCSTRREPGPGNDASVDNEGPAREALPAEHEGRERRDRRFPRTRPVIRVGTSRKNARRAASHPTRAVLRDARRLRPLGAPARVVVERPRRSHLDEERWELGEVGIER